MTKPRILGVLFQLLLTAVISPVLSVHSLPDGGDHDRFKRRDPLKSFRYYNGSFNVQDKHYWAVSLSSSSSSHFFFFVVDLFINVELKVIF